MDTPYDNNDTLEDSSAGLKPQPYSEPPPYRIANHCTYCGHAEGLHPKPFGGCLSCLHIVRSNTDHVVCGAYGEPDPIT